MGVNALRLADRAIGDETAPGRDSGGQLLDIDERDPRPPRRELYRIPAAMRILSLSRSVIYELIRAGRLDSVTEGRTRLVPASAIKAYVALLIREAGPNDDGAA